MMTKEKSLIKSITVGYICLSHLLHVGKVFQSKMKNPIIIMCITIMYSCAGNPPGASIQSNEYNNIINMYSGDYFIGVGTGKGSTKETAIKIAKARALGELSDNIKVTILSKLEIKTTATTHGETTQLDETVKEKIISIGNATVRSPEYEILNISKKDANFYAEVLAKKLKNKHVEESAKSLELEDAGEALMKMIIKKKK